MLIRMTRETRTFQVPPKRLIIFIILLLPVMFFISHYFGVFTGNANLDPPRNAVKRVDAISAEILKRYLVHLELEGSVITREQVREALAHPSELIRYKALTLLKTDFSEPTTRYIIDRALHDPSPLVRSAAAHLLALRQTSEEILPVVIAMLSDESEETQDAALSTLLRFKNVNAVNMILNNTTVQSVTFSQLRALGILGGTSAQSFLVEVMMTRPFLASAAANALSMTGEGALDVIMHAAHSDRSPEEKARLALYFAFDASKKADTILLSMKKSKDSSIRSIAENALNTRNAFIAPGKKK